MSKSGAMSHVQWDVPMRSVHLPVSPGKVHYCLPGLKISSDTRNLEILSGVYPVDKKMS